MGKASGILQIDLRELDCAMETLGCAGAWQSKDALVRDLLTGLHLARPDKEGPTMVATNRLFALGPVREVIHAVRRVFSLEFEYRLHIMRLLLNSIQQLIDDRALGETLEQLDHLSPELLQLLKLPSTCGAADHVRNEQHETLDRFIWQAPDAITLLSKVVENPGDVAAHQSNRVIPVAFDWLNWDTPPAEPAPAPWGDASPLSSSLKTTRHPFWGAMVATLDACTGDYQWQSLILRNGVLRCQHRKLGDASTVLAQLWKRELGLYPVAPLVLPKEMACVAGQRLEWLQRALDQLAQNHVAVESEGSWRLTDRFRSQLMKDDEHMMIFESVRRRSFRLAQAAAMVSELTEEVVAT